jgi:hypothetical protein
MRPHEIGGYAGPHDGVTWIAGKLAVTGGGPGIFLVNPRLGLGWSHVTTDGDADGLSLFYVGPNAEYWFLPDRVFSLSAGACAAWGQVTLRAHRDSAAQQADFLCLEPTLTARLRLFSFFGLNLGFGYRLALMPRPLPGFGNAAISGPSAFLGLSYGVYPGLNDAPGDRSLRVIGCWSQKFTWLKGRMLRLDGGGTRLVINRRFMAGVGGYFCPDAVRDAEYEVTLGQAGLWLEYVPWPEGPVTPSFSLMAGIGAPAFVDAGDSAQVFPAPLLDPDLLLNLNVTAFIRVHIGAGYRLYFGRPDVAGWTAPDFRGFTLTAGMKVGEF